jgi:hypothetical protein
LILCKNRQYLNYLVNYKSEPPSWKFLQMSLHYKYNKDMPEQQESISEQNLPLPTEEHPHKYFSTKI